MHVVFKLNSDHRDLHVLTHSFPTRRSSDRDLGLRARLLRAEIVRRHAQHHQPAVAVTPPQRLQLGILRGEAAFRGGVDDHPRTPLRSEEHTSELQSLMRISYAVFCLKTNPIHTLIYHKPPYDTQSTT